MHNFVGICGIFENMDRPQPTCAKADKVSRLVLRRAKEIYIVLLCSPKFHKLHRSRFWEPIDPLPIPRDSILQILEKCLDDQRSQQSWSGNVKGDPWCSTCGEYEHVPLCTGEYGLPQLKSQTTINWCDEIEVSANIHIMFIHLTTSYSYHIRS